MTIGAHSDARDWDKAVQALSRRFLRNTFTAVQQSEWLIERLVKTYLRTFTHPEGTPTPSPPGGPPALVSGNLRRSWRNVAPHPGRKPGTVEGGGGPTAVYARIHELGGTIVRASAPRTDLTRTSEAPANVYRIRIPKRPYVRPMVLVARRGVRRIHIDQWTQAIRDI